MGFYKQVVLPIFKQVDAEKTHERTLSLLAWGQAGWRRSLLARMGGTIPDTPVNVLGLTFPNVLGMAAGFDKDARVAAGLAKLGFGHIEVGTVTPNPQPGNPRPRIIRLPQDEALINRMGFPSSGLPGTLPNLIALSEKKRDFVLGVSLGKQKVTPLAEAVSDYVQVARAVYPYADYLAVNISSPNTPGLRELQGGEYLSHLLQQLVAEAESLAAAASQPRRPLLVKIDPDLSHSELDEMMAAVIDNNVDGIIATNTTIRRDGVKDPNGAEAGGVSGPPLRQQCTEVISYIHKHTDGQLPIIGVGGIATAEDIQEKLDAGAVLVQLYTSLVYEGPRLPGRLLRSLAAGAKQSNSK